MNTQTFSVMVSLDAYQNKEQARLCLCQENASSIGRSKMAFTKRNLTVEEFAGLAATGHTFCAVFEPDPDREYWLTNSRGDSHKSKPYYTRKGRNYGALRLDFKRDEFFSYSQAVFIDVDLTSYSSLPEYIDALTVPPSFAYTTYSDKADKGGIVSRRFRLVYLFSDKLDKDMFASASLALTCIIERDTREDLDDDCGLRPSQYFNGTYFGDLWLPKGEENVYSYLHIFPYKCIGRRSAKKEVKKVVPEVAVKETKKVPEVEFTKSLVSDMERLEYSEFMHYYSTRYGYFYRTVKPEWNDGLYQETDDAYLALFYNVSRLKDGQQRRKKLFDRACLRRIINPDVTPDALLFNLYVDREKFYDNSDGVLSIDKLQEKVSSSFKYTVEELKEMYSETLEYWRENRPRYIFHPNVRLSENRHLLGRLRKIANSNTIGELYDPSLSVAENLKEFESYGIKFSRQTVYNFCKENGIETNPSPNPKASYKPSQQRTELLDFVKSQYDVNLTREENYERLNGLNEEVTIYLVEKVCKQYKQVEDSRLNQLISENYDRSKSFRHNLAALQALDARISRRKVWSYHSNQN